MKPTYWLFGTKLQVLQNQNDTDGRYDLLEGLFPPCTKSPLHLHSHYSETIIVLEGEVTVYTPGQEQVLKAGDNYYIPKNVPHMIANNSSTAPFKALALASPSGFSHLVEMVGIPDDGSADVSQRPHDMELACKVLDEVGDTILGPPGTRP